MRPEAGEESARWLEQAEAELADARELAARGRYYLSLYLCQQSAEKALKAFIYSREEEPIFSHSVATLLSIAASIDSAFEGAFEARRLDDYYIPTRYPNGLPGGVPASYYDDSEEVEVALSRAASVVELVARLLRN